uniref:Lipase n=1 Tax=Strigamia maritima TaxID=126957 RepID=T1JMH0_STRMM
MPTDMHFNTQYIVLLHVVTCQITTVQLLHFVNDIPLNSPMDEDLYQEATMETTELINFYGYPAENYTVYTVDGYILTIHRIPHGKQNSGNVTRKPILLMHGILASSAYFIESGKPSLGFFLADNGYDVWLGNMRGNFYSDHTKYNRKDKQFWDFSWEEMAEYDVPMMIDFVLKATSFEKLMYVAHSMGTTVSFALFSTQPDYHKKVSGFIALSPIGSLLVINIFGVSSVPNLKPKYFKLEASFCPESDPILCSLGIALSGGYSEDLRNKSRDFLYAIHASAGASFRTLDHFAQMALRKGLYRYDYGRFKNLFMKYKKTTPPQYFLNKISIPVVLFHSANDAFADPLDVTILSRNLPNLLGIELVGPPTMNHLDMIYALDAKNIYHDKLLSYLNKM